MKNIKMMIPSLMLATFTAQSVMAKVGCSVVKVVSQDSKTKVTSYSTGFAIRGNAVIVNDHSLAEGAQSVQVFVDGQKMSGTVKGRDFHTDLAAIQIEDSRLTACSLGSASVKTIDRIELAGMEKEDLDVSVQIGLVKNPNSKKLLVPGANSSIEIIGTEGSNLVIEKSNSGSPLFLNNQVVGMLTQKTKEGTGLALPAEQIRQVAPILLAGNDMPRPYTYDHRESKFEFRGLEMKSSNQVPTGVKDVKSLKRGMEMNGNPHESGNPHDGSKGPKEMKNMNEIFEGNPHDGSKGEIKIGAYGPGQTTTSVSLEDYNLGAAVANLGNIETLKKYQPELARVLEKGNIKQIYINSIDGIGISSLFEMIQVLGSCRACIIDGYWISHQDPEQIENQSMRAISLMTQLLTTLEKEKGGVNFVRSLMPDMEALNRLLAQDARLTEAGMRNPLVIRSLNQQWNRIEKLLESRWISDSSRDLLNQIRLLIPVE